MRSAIVAAGLAACLVMPAYAASFQELPSEAAAANSAQNEDDAAFLAKAFKVHAQVATPAENLREAAQQTHHVRFAHHLLEYYPLGGDSPLHFSFGMQKDKRGLGQRPFYVQGVKMFSGGPSSDKRHVSPGFAVAYDKSIAQNTTLSFDAGMRRDRDAFAAQLNRLASLDGQDRQRLGAHSSRFGPAAHLTFIHAF